MEGRIVSRFVLPFLLFFLILLIVVFSNNSYAEPTKPFVLSGQEVSVDSVKYSNTDGVFLTSPGFVNCKWKSPSLDDGYKVCEVVFGVEDSRMFKSIIENPLIYLDFENSQNIKNVEILYSFDSFVLSNLKEESLLKSSNSITGKSVDSFTNSENIKSERVFANFIDLGKGEVTLEEVNESILEKRNSGGFTGKVVSFFSPNSFDTSKPFAVLVRFEIPKYEENKFDFSIFDNGFSAKIDPDITGCGVLDTPNSVYTLNQSVNSSRTCFEVASNNITIDCQGNQILFGESVNQSYGVYSNSSETTVRNCAIKNINPGTSQGVGIYFESAPQGKVENNSFDIRGEFSFGVLGKQGSDELEIRDNSFSVNGVSSFGIKFEDSDNVLIHENDINFLLDSSKGIHFSSSSYGEIFDNDLRMDGFGSTGIHLFHGTGFEIYDNLLYSEDNTGDSISLEGSYVNNIYSNYLEVGGIYSAGYHSYGDSNRNFLWDNEIKAFDIDRYGIFLEGGFGTRVSNSSIFTDGDFGYGILIYSSDENFFENISINTRGNEASGIFLDLTSSENDFHKISSITGGASSPSLYVWYEDNNFSFYDSSFVSQYPGDPDIYFDSLGGGNSGGNFEFVNTSFESDFWVADANGLMEVFWYLDSETLYSDGEGVEGVEVKIYDEGWNLLFDEVTGNNFKIPTKTLKAYSKNGSSSVFPEGVYQVNSTFDSTQLSEKVNLTSNNFVSFTFPAPLIETTISSSGGSSCDALWVCSEWSSCVNEEMQRNCTNENPDCDAGKPETKKSCVEEVKVKEKKVIFDVNSKLLRQRITPPSNLSAKITLLNMGDSGKTNANLTYSIINSKGELLYFEEDTLVVDRQLEFMKTFPVDTYFEGRYDLYIDLEYEGQKDPASARERFYVGGGFYFTWINVLLIFFILVTSSLIVYSLVKKKLSERGNDQDGF